MWAGRLQASLAALTPLEIEVDTTADPAGLTDRVVDHLALDRHTVKADQRPVLCTQNGWVRS
jgi:hypothetical protein